MSKALPQPRDDSCAEFPRQRIAVRPRSITKSQFIRQSIARLQVGLITKIGVWKLCTHQPPHQSLPPTRPPKAFCTL